ncbi:hypothetical protein [Nocardia cyriacigeorgica]|uniref:hypothetical protein n=1 Tax=Nocardia cyriacigeorgica TaxID=135487 RepID=UPI0034DB79CE
MTSDQTPALLTDEQLRRIAAGSLCYPDVPGYMAGELLAARAEIAALRNDLDAKTSDFDAACRHLGEARERIAELEAARRPPSLRQYLQAFSDRDEAQSRAAELAERFAELEADHARLVEDVASTVRRFSATLDERDALRARLSELAAQQVYREVWSDEVAPGGMVCSICGHPVESEPCPTHAPDGYVVGWKYDGQLHITYDEAEPSYATAGEARVVAAECCCEDPNTEFRVYELREVVAE